MKDIELDEIERAQALDNIVDEAEKDDTVTPLRYEISSYGADFDVEGLIKRLQRDDIYVPRFQRGFVWSQKEASRFIESLLLGLPVPGIFLARDPETKKLLVIDGQQRLKSLRFFFEGIFAPDPDAKKQTVFKLENVQKQFLGLTYDKLPEDYRIIFNDSIIHATVVKQESPEEEEQSSIYYIFERLNTTGRKLSPQQIRVAIYHGEFLDLLHSLNEYEPWRKIFGEKSITLKDQELVIRFLALYYDLKKYGDSDDTKTMKGFLNRFAHKHRHCDVTFCDNATALFQKTVDVAFQAFSEKAFRPERALNAAFYDSVMVGIAKRLEHGEIKKLENLLGQYSKLQQDKDYVTATIRATSNEKSVKFRCNKAIEMFKDI